ncbi:MAG: filamentous hemagglutinin N-terminal domain-containing protein, partial [Prevotella sp.]
MKRKIRRTWHRKTAALAATMMAMSFGGISYAMPQGETIRSGHGEIVRQDKDMTINQDSKKLAIDWKGFDINNDERVHFNQPDAASIALNRVTGDAKTFIDGSLTANGQVFVINPNGVLFGQNASVDVGSLVASTARVSDSQMEAFGNGDGTLNLELADDSTAKVINEGTIRAEGGLVALHAASVENSGTIENEGGKIALAAAKNINLSADTAGKLNFTVDGALAKASTLNSGVLKADGGYVVMTAKQAGDVMSTVVNNTGTIEAKTLRQNEKGEILLDGGESGIVEINGTLDASGMEAGQSAGSIKAIGAETHVKEGAALLARGTVDGGLIETSGDYLEIGDTVNIDTSGQTGKTGEWLLDPTEVVISDTGRTSVSEGDNSYTRDTTYLKTSSIVNALKKNNVTIQAMDRTYHNADISLESALNVDQTTPGKNTLTLEAENDININADINATAALNVVLKADTDGDDKGGININADIRTGGGSLTTGANGATFFGGMNSGENNRVIETSGGAVNIQNEARLQLDGGTLSINTAGGNVTFARNVASMNKYEAFMDHDFVTYYKQDKKTRGKLSVEGQAWENMIKSVYGKDYTDSNGQRVRFIIDRRADYEKLSDDQKIEASNMLARIWELANLAATQNNSTSDPDGKNLDGQHLVTITDKYENSAAMANAVKKPGNVVEYFTGGKDVTGRTGDEARNTAGRTFAWVTGPEKDTEFYRTTGEGQGYDLNGNYTNWVRNEPIDPKHPNNGSYNEPNNNRGHQYQPYVAIGWTDQNGWDDVGNNTTTIHGFIRETELPNSALSINSGAGNVTVGTEGAADTGRLGSGEGTGLRNLSIETTTGDVKVLGSIYVHDNNANAAADLANGNVKIATQGNVDVGQITADKKVEIATTGADKDVNVNGKIVTDGLVSIEATDDITVHGIENGDKIRLISTDAAGDGAITLAENAEGGGAMVTSSGENDAVIIDARGANGSFHNATDATKAKSAIKTGEGGNWKVYSASPDRDTFGTNLNSETTARWHASSQGGNGLDTYAETKNTNKYIFQVQPTLSITADDKTKTYGETVELTAHEKAEFTGKDGNLHDVTGYTDAFQEVSDGGSIMDHYNGSYTLSSAGQAASATRTNGNRQAGDGERAIYDINVDTHLLQGLDGYAVGTPNKGKLEITRRTVVLNGSASQTYGDATLKDKNVYAETGTKGEGLVNGDALDTSGVEYTISDRGKYAASKNAHTNGVTADAGTYEDELLFRNVHFTNNADANYTVTGNGDITVNPYTIKKDDLVINGEPLYTTVYGTKKDLGTAKFTGVNGDAAMDLAITDTDALTGANTGRLTNDAGDHYYTIVSLNDAQSKNYRFEDGATSKQFNDTASVTKKKLELITDDISTTYGDGNTILKKLNNNLLHLEGLANGDNQGDILTEIKAEISVKDNLSAFKLDEAGNIITDPVTGQHYTNDAHQYSITTSYYNIAKNYDTVMGENAAGHTVGNIYVKKAPLTVNRTGYETTYGTVITDDAAHRFTTWSGLVNGDVDDIYINYKDYGGAYKDNNTRTNNAGTYSFSKGLQSKSNVLRNYEVNDTQKNWVKINPYALTDADILNATYTTTYGSRSAFGTAKLKDINGDGELNLKIVGSSALTGKYKGRVTQDVGQNIYNTIVSLDAIYGAHGFDLKNYTLNGKTLGKNDRMTIANSASVTPADLTVKVGNVWTNYGEAFDPDEYDYSIQNPANGDDAAALKSELGKLDYVN